MAVPVYYAKIQFTIPGWVDYINANGLSLSQYGNGGVCLILTMESTSTPDEYLITEVSGTVLGEAVSFLPGNTNPTNYVWCSVDNTFKAVSPYFSNNGFDVANAANTHQYNIYGLNLDAYFDNRSDSIGNIVFNASYPITPNITLDGNNSGNGCTDVTVPGSGLIQGINSITFSYAPVVSIISPDPACSFAPIPCFLADAPVLTPNGYKAIATLKIGDLVSTPRGDMPIQKVKISRVVASPSVNPYIIKRGQFGATKRLLISPNHRVQTENGMIEARSLGLRQEEMSGSFDYYNLELPNWTNMIVAGVVVESLAPVKRLTMTMQEFKGFITDRYGPMTPDLYKMIQKSARMLQDGRIAFSGMGTNA